MTIGRGDYFPALNKVDPSASDGVWGPTTKDHMRFLSSVMKRQFGIFLILHLIVIGLAVTYLSNATPGYLASTLVVIDFEDKKSFALSKTNSGDNIVDVGIVQSQIEILKSAKIQQLAIDRLHLTSDDEFVYPGLVSRIYNKIGFYFGIQPDKDPAILKSRAMARFYSNCTVTRLVQSNVIEVDFVSSDPAKAARIANGVAEVYVTADLQSRYESARRAGSWLHSRLTELLDQANARKKASEEFREKNNIIGAEGQLLNEKQLSEINSQFVLAQASTAEAKARYERIREGMKQEVPDASTIEGLNSEVIIKLRKDYLQLTAREAFLSSKYGPSHQATVNLRSQMKEVLLSIRAEMSKIEQSYKTEYEIAQAREQSLGASLNESIDKSQVTNQARIELQELDSNASTYRSLYDNFLQRYMDSVQQQSFPLTAARIIAADVPLTPTYPKTLLIALLTAFGGFTLSFGTAALREVLDGRVRSRQQVESALNVKCLALLPDLKPKRGMLRFQSVNAHEIPDTRLLSYVLDYPFSQFAESMRTIKVECDRVGKSKLAKVIGITSSLPNEGKSTVAINYAHLLANSGRRTILLDCDLRNPQLSGLLSRNRYGLTDAVANSLFADNIEIVNSSSGLRMLSAGSNLNGANTDEILRSEGMAKLIYELENSYQYIILDLPPLIPLVDTRATADFVDCFLYVCEWGRTRIDTVEHCLYIAPEVHERLISVIINKANTAFIGRYDQHYHSYQYGTTRAICDQNAKDEVFM